MEELINYLKRSYENAVRIGDDLNAKDWDWQQGILITPAQAKIIIEMCEGKESQDESDNCIKPAVIKSVCPKCASEDVIWTCYCNCCHECM